MAQPSARGLLLDGVERLVPRKEPPGPQGSRAGRTGRLDASPGWQPGKSPRLAGSGGRLRKQSERPPTPWFSGREGVGASLLPNAGSGSARGRPAVRLSVATNIGLWGSSHILSSKGTSLATPKNTGQGARTRRENNKGGEGAADTSQRDIASRRCVSSVLSSRPVYEPRRVSSRSRVHPLAPPQPGHGPGGPR